MDYIQIGRIIKEKRKTKKITQVQLAKTIGISQSFISKIEKGIHKSDFHLIERLTFILEIDMQLFKQNSLHYSHTERTLQFINKTDKFLKNYQYDDVNRLIQKEKKTDYSTNFSLQKAFLRLEARLSFIYNKELEEALPIFQNAINLSTKSLCDITQNAEIYISLGNCFAESKKYSDAIQSYKYALSLIEQFALYNKIRLKIRTLYNLAKCYREQASFIKAQHYIKEAIKLSIEHENMGLLNHLYYQNAMILNQMKLLPECRKMLDRAKHYAYEMGYSEIYPFLESFHLILELNAQNIWEYKGKWLTDYNKEEMFLLYTKIFP